MKYLSTREDDGFIGYSFQYALFSGLAINKGLFIPETIPKININKEMDFYEIAFVVFRAYIHENEINNNDLYNILKRSFENYRSQRITPLVHLENSNINILELFWGPTYSFKDIALGVIGNLFEYFLNKYEKENNNFYNIYVLCATSGDTGSAAIHSLKGKDKIRCCVLHPHDKISNIQRLQMTTVLDDNVKNFAIDGSFDDCQRIVKNLLLEYNFVAVNSINWARILTQMVYYFYSYVQYIKTNDLQWGVLINYSVPTGNFGDILAGYYAKHMGLPIDKLIIATNKNDTISRFLESGNYSSSAVMQSLSPAMDISIPSNFERLLYHVTLDCNESREKTCELINSQMVSGEFTVSKRILMKIKEDFVAKKISDEETLYMIKKIHDNDNYIIDPHTAVGISAYYKYLLSKNYQSEDITIIDNFKNLNINKVICLSTAHPGKFANTVKIAIGECDIIPLELSNLVNLPEKYKIISNDEVVVLNEIIN